jgi:hypothetical protein
MPHQARVRLAAARMAIRSADAPLLSPHFLSAPTRINSAWASSRMVGRRPMGISVASARPNRDAKQRTVGPWSMRWLWSALPLWVNSRRALS